MRKISKFQLPNAPAGPIVVFDRYDTFFREKLRRAVREDFEQFPEGLPTYHAFLTKIVRDYAGEITNPDSLSLKDLENFLKGLQSHVPRIQILDAYIQITKPALRRTFSIDAYIEHVGDVFSEYMASHDLDDYEREIVVQNAIGVYRVSTRQSRNAKDNSHPTPRYFVVCRAKSNRFLLCYEFSAFPRATVHAEREEQYKLVAGICVPQVNSSLIFMRDFRYRHRRIGKIVVIPQQKRHLTAPKEDDPVFRAAFTLSDDELDLDDYFMEMHSVNYISLKPGKWFDYLASPLKEGAEKRKIEAIVDSFGAVF